MLFSASISYTHFLRAPDCILSRLIRATIVTVGATVSQAISMWSISHRARQARRCTLPPGFLILNFHRSGLCLFFSDSRLLFSKRHVNRIISTPSALVTDLLTNYLENGCYPLFFSWCFLAVISLYSRSSLSRIERKLSRTFHHGYLFIHRDD